VVVYGKTVPTDTADGPVTTYYACMRPNGKGVAIGQSSPGSEYPGNLELLKLRIAGKFVANLSGRGFAAQASCYKYGGTDCGASVVWWVDAADTRLRRTLRVAVSRAISSLAVSNAGVVAWILPGGDASSSATLQATVIHEAVRPGQHPSVETLDTGAISNLRFSGPTLHWSNRGRAESRTL
jgi:hypothetical protein